MNEDQLLNELETRFGVIPEDSILDKEELRFLDDRNKFEDIYSWSFDTFVKHYQLIKAHALEAKLLDKLSWMIRNLYGTDELNQLKETDFFKRFGETKIIEEAILEVEQRGK